MPGILPDPTEEEGIMISFGNNDNGGRNTESETPIKTSVNDIKPKPSSKPAVNQEFITQKDNSLAVTKQKIKEKEKKEQALLEEQRIERLRKEQAALEQQRIDAERRAAEKRRKEQEAIDRANMDGMFGNSGGSGSGNTSGNTQQGNPVGKGSSGGNSWSLTGRNLSGRLVAPNYDNDVEGRITVNIRVNENGSVTSATIGSPTTIGDAQTRNAAISAAKNTRFSSAKDISTGSITYNFKLK